MEFNVQGFQTMESAADGSEVLANIIWLTFLKNNLTPFRLSAFRYVFCYWNFWKNQLERLNSSYPDHKFTASGRRENLG